MVPEAEDHSEVLFQIDRPVGLKRMRQARSHHGRGEQRQSKQQNVQPIRSGRATARGRPERDSGLSNGVGGTTISTVAFAVPCRA